MCGDDEQQSGDREQPSCDNRPRPGEFELWDLCGYEPGTGEKDEQEADFGEAYGGMARESKDWLHERHSASLWHVSVVYRRPAGGMVRAFKPALSQPQAIREENCASPGNGPRAKSSHQRIH